MPDFIERKTTKTTSINKKGRKVECGYKNMLRNKQLLLTTKTTSINTKRKEGGVRLQEYAT